MNGFVINELLVFYTIEHLKLGILNVQRCKATENKKGIATGGLYYILIIIVLVRISFFTFSIIQVIIHWVDKLSCCDVWNKIKPKAQ